MKRKRKERIENQRKKEANLRTERREDGMKPRTAQTQRPRLTPDDPQLKLSSNF